MARYDAARWGFVLTIWLCCRALLYDPWAHGAVSTYWLSGGSVAVIALLGAAFVRLSQRRLWRWWPVAALAGLLLLGDALPLAWRLWPYTVSGVRSQRWNFASQPALQRLLAGTRPQPFVDGSGAAEWVNSGLRLSVADGLPGRAYISGPAYVPPRRSEARLWLPRGLLDAPPEEDRLEWRVLVRRSGEYLVLLDEPGLLIQVTRAGLLISAGRPGQGDMTSQTLSQPGIEDGRAHALARVRTRNRVSVVLDGEVVWSMPVAVTAISGFQPGDAWRLGATRSDPLHGGQQVILQGAHAIRVRS